MQNSSPVSRLQVVDALRGFALMGVFFVHMVEYFELYWYNPEAGFWPELVHNGVFFLFGGKAYSVFAMLFGLSFFLIMERNRLRGVDFRPRFVWRLVLLLGFGYLNSLVYSGDILQVLALTGIIAVLVFRLRTAAVMGVSLALTLQLPNIIRFFVTLTDPASATRQPLHWALMGANFEVFAHGSFADVLVHSLWQGQLGKWAFLYESGRLWTLIGLSCLGIVLGRIGFFENIEQRRRQQALGVILSVCCGTLLYFATPKIAVLAPEGLSRIVLGDILGSYLNLAIACFGVCLFLLLFQMRVVGRLLQLFAPCGKMSLTVYVAQGFCFVPVFYGYGLGLYATIGQVKALALAAVFWPVQLLACRAWLQRFCYGPLEWVWRAATYLRRDIPLRALR